MDPLETSNRRREAQRRLWARRRRTGELRTRVVALTLVGFVLLWGVVFTQMATGNDPVLGGGRHSPSAAKTDRREAEGAALAAHESVETTDPEESSAEEEQVPAEIETVEPEPEFEPEPEPEPEAEFFFEPEVVETTQS
jgi:outer membrane biosynthesis protein TonB